MEKRGFAAGKIGVSTGLFCMCMLFSCNRLDGLLEKGALNLQLGDYNRARSAYEAAVDRFPESPRARLGLGKALLQEYSTRPGDSALLINCLTQLEAARTLRSDSSVEQLLGIVWFKRADRSLAGADTVAALQALSRAISLDPNATGPVNLAGILYFHRGDHDRALNLFNKVIVLDSGSVSGYFNAGMVHWVDSNFTAAYDCFFRAAQRASPGDREILMWAARAKQAGAHGTP